MMPVPASARTAHAAPPSSPTPATQPSAQQAAPAPERVHVDGFRSAQWGMTEAQVKAAIQKDFNIAADKIKPEENLAERTQVLTVAVPDLLEGAGQARVSYIFGYASKKLIQVNILWGTGLDRHVTPERIVAAANQLRELFAESGYDPATAVSNVRMSDGSILVFEGADADKHTTVLRLASASQASHGDKPGKVTEAALSLSYIMDARHPDIYRLKKGQF
jgi:hypothetical protein